MTQQMGKRIYRPATAKEQEQHTRIREQIRQELPDIKKRARRKLAEAIRQGIALEHTMAVLKAERLKQGLSLTEMKERTGMERSALSRLENNVAANPTVNTLTRYAAAVGKKALVVLVTDDGN